MQITPLGDSALIVELGDSISESTHLRVQAAWSALAAEPMPGVSETVPAYTTVTLFYDPAQVVRAGPRRMPSSPGWATACANG